MEVTIWLPAARSALAVSRCPFTVLFYLPADS
jgi:hypothetical protein